MGSNELVQGAVALWVRSDWRRRRRSIVVLVLLAGLAGAVVLVAVAGARRTASSFERLAESAHPANLLIDVGAVDPTIVDQISRLPTVVDHGAYTVVFALVEGVDTDLAILAPLDDRIGSTFEISPIVRGHRPDPGRADEVAINETTARIVGADIGDEISVATMTAEQVREEDYSVARGPTLRLHVVGVVRGPDDVSPGTEGGFIASEAFIDTVRGEVDEWTTYLAVRLDEGADVADFEAALAEMIPPGQEYESLSFEARSNAVRNTISTLASGLTMFAVVAAAAAVVTIGQAVGRHVAAAEEDSEILRQLGFTPSDRRRALILSTTPVALGSVVVAALAVWLVSPTMPIGLARRAEPDLGHFVDWTALGVGALAILAVVFGSAAISASWVTPARRPVRPQRGPSALADAFSRTGVGAAATNGVRLALDRRTPALPVRSAMAGVALAILGTTAVLTFSSSLDRLLATPARWGFGWDLVLDFTSSDIESATERIGDDDELGAIARWDAGFTHVEGRGVRAYGLTPHVGRIGYALRSGRQPERPDEVVLGPVTADQLGVHLGDQVRVSPESGAANATPVTVVGTALFPDDGEGHYRDGVGYFGAAFAEHAVVPDLFEASQLAVVVRPGLAVDDVATHLNDEYPDSVSSGENRPVQPAQVANLARVRSLPMWLAAFVAVLGITSLAHLLGATLSRRRTELATLRSLGLTPGQTLSCIVWQALTVTSIGLVIGVPLGIVAGKAAWSAVAGPIGVATDIDQPVILLTIASLVTLAIAAAIALVPGWRAGRTRPAQALRVE